MMQPDFGKVDRNLAKLFKAGAPDSDVQSYLQSEGVTPEQVTQWKASAGANSAQQVAAAPQETAPAQPGVMERFVDPAINAVTGAAKYVQGSIQGKHDPRYKDVPQLEKNSGIIMDGIADTSAVTDAAYADVWKKTLEDEGRYIGTKTDENGYKLIEFVGKDGKPDIGYVNKPGLDWKDVSRGVSAALPYMAAGGAVGRTLGFFGATGAATNIAGQALGAAATSGAQDVAARQVGSEQGLDVNRMAFSAGFAGGGELLGRAIGPFIQRWRGDKTVWQADDKGNLTLTERGKTIAKKEGVAPDITIDAADAKKVLGDTARAQNPGEAIIQARTGEFNIPTSSAQRSKEPLAIQIEKDLRIDTLGPAAGKRMRDFDETQREAIKRAALGDGAPVPVGQYPFTPNQVGPTIAPGRTLADLGRAELGLSVQGGLKQAVAKAKELEENAWSKVTNIEPKTGAFASLDEIMQKSLGSARTIDEVLTPNAWRMSKQIEGYINGNAIRNPAAPEFLGQQSVKYVDEMRQTLLGMKNGVVDLKDKAAANALYGGFLDWIDDAAEKSLLTGGPSAAAALRDARGATRTMRELFKPKDAGGAKSPITRTLERVENAYTGEEVLNALIGTSSSQASVPDGVTQAIKHYKAATTKLGGKEGADAWNDLRLAKWVQIVTDKKGDMLSPGALTKSIEMAIKNQSSLMRELYTQPEVALMLRYGDAVKQTNWRPFDINPSGTGTINRSAAKAVVEEQVRFQGQSARAKGTFGGDKSKLLESRLWRMLGTYIKQLEKPVGRTATNRAVSQDLVQKQVPASGGYFSATIPSQDRDPRNQKTQ